jgi:hypothetical protein
MINWSEVSLKDLSGYLSEEFKKEEIEIILVGGACVTIYSENRYQSHDLDFVTYEDFQKVRKVLKNLGFVESSGYFSHKDCQWIVEFVSPPIAVGEEPIQEFSEIETGLGTVKLLKVSDSVKDRLASFYHWNDRQGLEQAISICLESTCVDFSEIESWSEKEGFKKEFQHFLRTFESKKG